MSAKAIRELLQIATRLHQAGQLDRAEQLYQQMLLIRPGQADAVHLLGVIACQRQQFDRAVTLISMAISASPKTSAYHNSLGNALRSLNKLPEAISSFRKAFALDENNLETLNNLAIALESDDQSVEAIACFDRLILVRRDVAQIHANRGNAQLNAGMLSEAILSYRRAIALEPHFAAAHAKLAVALLSAGQYAEGWREAEWRFASDAVPDPCVGDASPRWDGSPLAGRTLVVRTEQGFGDTIQFVRYVSLIGGGKVIVQCQPALERLFKLNAVADEVIAVGTTAPEHDLQIPMLSLPFVFKTELDHIPLQTPPLRVKLTSPLPTSDKYRVGLFWAGNPGHGNDRRRSCPADVFNMLADLPNIEFHRLQLPATLRGPSALTLIDRTDGLKNFADTAELVAQLDLVIAVDTAVAHLTGAMAKKIWILLPFAAEWRWMTERDDSPWYPTAKLFRQYQIGDWSDVMQRVRAELAHQLTDHKSVAAGLCSTEKQARPQSK